MAPTPPTKAKHELNREGLNPWRWMPPELYVSGRLDTYSDIWSFGVVMWELFSLGKLPYKGVKNFSSWVQFVSYRLRRPNDCPMAVYLLSGGLGKILTALYV